jgi:hypothetical protein
MQKQKKIYDHLGAGPMSAPFFHSREESGVMHDEAKQRETVWATGGNALARVYVRYANEEETRRRSRAGLNFCSKP